MRPPLAILLLASCAASPSDLHIDVYGVQSSQERAWILEGYGRAHGLTDSDSWEVSCKYADQGLHCDLLTGGVSLVCGTFYDTGDRDGHPFAVQGGF